MKTLLLILSLMVPGSVLAEGVLTPAANPPDAVLYDYRNSIRMQDDFIVGVPTSGSVGSLGWSAGGSLSGIASVANHYGILRLDTSATSGTLSRISINTVAASSSGVDPAARITETFLVRLNNNDANTTFRLGLGNSAGSTPPADGIYFEKLDADTNWFCTTRATSVSTHTDSGIAVDTGWHTFTIISTATVVTFFLDGVPVCSNTANITTTFLSFLVQIVNSAAAAKTVDIDYFEAKITGFTR